MSSATYAVHQVLGRTATPARTSKWVQDESEEYGQGPSTHDPKDEIEWLDSMGLGSALRRQLLYQNGSSCDVVRDVFQRGNFSRHKLDIARTIFNETGGIYPHGVEAILGELTFNFNEIPDGDLLQQLKIRANSVRSSEQAAMLMGEIDRIVEQVRTKDRIATNIVMVAQAFDAAIAQQEKRHLELPTFGEEVETLLWRAMSLWGNNCLFSSFEEEFSLRDVAVLKTALRITKEDVVTELYNYFNEAEDSRHVEYYLTKTAART